MFPTCFRRASLSRCLLLSIVALAVLMLAACVGVRAGTKRLATDDRKVIQGKDAEELISLKLEVDALEKLYHLDLNAEQRAAFLKLAEKTAARKPAPRETVATAEYRQVLKDLQGALLQEEEDRIHDLSEKLDALHEKEAAKIDDEFEMTDAALKAAPQAFRLLSAAQIVAYLAALDDEVPDPVERILSAVEEGEDLDDEEWAQLRDDTAEEVAWLVAGFNTENAAKASKSVKALLDRGHRFKGDELKKEWPAVEKTAHQLVGAVSSLVVIQHYMERELAELLSNPRTTTALRLWDKREQE